MRTISAILLFVLSLVNYAHADTITMYQGKEVANSAQNNGQTTESYGAEVERTMVDGLHYSLGYFNQGTLRIVSGGAIKRDIFAAQMVLPVQLTENVGISFEAGPALADTTTTYLDGSYSDSTSLVLVHDISIQYSVTEQLSAVAMFQRTDLTQYSSDGYYVGIRFTPLSF
jgi:hypothetical protein